MSTILSSAPVQAQAPPRAPVVSPEVRADRTVTFRLDAPEAKTVKVWVEWNRKGTDLTYLETGGAHQWIAWRRGLAALAPRLFKSDQPARE